MMKIALLAIMLVFVILVSGCTSQSDGQQTSTNVTVPEQQPAEAPNSAIVSMSGAGFSPSEVTIKQGGTVTWINVGSATIWPASAFHPTHEAYPGSSITKCGTAEETSVFDACRGIPPGGSWSFTFSEKGPWAYHDHLNPSRFGRVNAV